jgi:Fe-S cluster biogenesis protein NfuA
VENTTTFDRVAAAQGVEQVLDLIRPAVQADGGDVSLVSVDEAGVVTIAMHGACGGCPMSTLTVKSGIERILKDRVPGVTAVETEEEDLFQDPFSLSVMAAPLEEARPGVEATPNPNAMKFALPTPVDAPMTYTSADAAAGTPFAAVLSLPGVLSVFVNETYATVTKEPSAFWDEIVDDTVAALSGG